jgi:hypothetical protein
LLLLCDELLTVINCLLCYVHCIARVVSTAGCWLHRLLRRDKDAAPDDPCFLQPMRISADALMYVDPRLKDTSVSVAAGLRLGSNLGTFVASAVDPPAMLLLPSEAQSSASPGFDLGSVVAGAFETPADSTAAFGSLPDSSSSSSGQATPGAQPSYQMHPLNQTALPEPEDWSRAKRLAMRRSKEITAAAAFPFNAVGKLTLLDAEGVPR